MIQHLIEKTSVGSGFSTAKARSPIDNPSVRKRIESMPKSCRGNYIKAVNGTASHRQAIKALCMECVCWDRAEVAACTAPACPLYKYRPFKTCEEDQTNSQVLEPVELTKE